MCSLFIHLLSGLYIFLVCLDFSKWLGELFKIWNMQGAKRTNEKWEKKSRKREGT